MLLALFATTLYGCYYTFLNSAIKDLFISTKRVRSSLFGSIDCVFWLILALYIIGFYIKHMAKVRKIVLATIFLSGIDEIN